MARLSLMRRIFGSASPAERRHRPRAGAPGGMQILVVDDSATIRAVLGKMLTQNGHAVVGAASGEVALERARENVPDLIFLDIVMPGMSGFAVLRALRRDPRTRAIPVIMISGNPQATEQFYVQRFGADDFMKKPFARGDVFARIMRLNSDGRIVVGKHSQREHALAVGESRADAAAVSSAEADAPAPVKPPDRHG